jgi:hypothetical protein
MTTVHKEKVNGCKIKIMVDDCPEDPRKAWDHQWTMALFNHRRYTLGDQEWADALPAGAMDDAEEALHRQNGGEYWPDDLEIQVAAIQRQAKRGAIIAFPVYMYDHSGLAFSLGNDSYPFNCQWDAGIIGYMFVKKDDVRHEWGKSRISPKLMKTITSNAKAELGEYEGYVNGWVYGYEVTRKGEVIDSCWGYYGHEGYEYALQLAKEAAEAHEK